MGMMFSYEARLAGFCGLGLGWGEGAEIHVLVLCVGWWEDVLLCKDYTESLPYAGLGCQAGLA